MGGSGGGTWLRSEPSMGFPALASMTSGPPGDRTGDPR